MTTTDKLAGREALFREVNENIASLAGLLTAEEYEAVRAHPTRFVVKHGHRLAGTERVVDGNGRFLVVEKIGRAADIAQTDDPRHP